ncbi:hypothetical protein HLB10_13430 [Cellulomonas fimi]|uniref:Uncharacterized protein n=1 Tax=Cellulomonas fimi (strain ATCC 484 / DSM 20113 / JCM 1341 / CCUG 24087 / LMG 16345 / NBRC 15513 / NCIMB 8980 / NCTC 7547 / NRS-133) TaxID=590998 RepID=F4H6J5_CELFA|nr:hypothetical protein Celf_1493 [Cellulomonas fimi ATCC 484]NNH08078.1 hypothetical protein [Cellulomonas fimi]VEH30116.1 Uncharacterised protein [Cellulomonas fimi]
MLIGIVVSLVVAAAVLVLAGAEAAADARGDSRGGPWRTFRDGWRARRHPDPAQRAAAVAASADPVDVSLQELLSANVEQGDAYLQVDDLSAALERAARRAGSALPRQQRGA